LSAASTSTRAIRIRITPLHEAAFAGTVEMVTLLLASGADIGAVDSSQETVCHCAARNVCDGVMRALIRAGADFRTVSVTGLTPMQIAIESDNRFAISALIDAGVSLADENENRASDAAMSVAATPAAAALRLLVRNGADIRRVDENGQTVCHVASSQGLAVAIALGADVNALDSEGRAAIFRSLDDRFLTLVAAGADLEARDESGTSAADRIRENGLPNDIATIAVVLGANATPDDEPRIDPHHLAWARHRLAARQFELLRLRAFEICVGLQSRNLTALELCEILTHAFAPRQLLVPLHRVWSLATTIKHFHEASSS
jgi:ankyrin repeat protein